MTNSSRCMQTIHCYIGTHVRHERCKRLCYDIRRAICFQQIWKRLPHNKF